MLWFLTYVFLQELPNVSINRYLLFLVEIGALIVEPLVNIIWLSIYSSKQLPPSRVNRFLRDDSELRVLLLPEQRVNAGKPEVQDVADQDPLSVN